VPLLSQFRLDYFNNLSKWRTPGVKFSARTHICTRYVPWKARERQRVPRQRSPIASMWDSRAITCERAGKGKTADKPNNEQPTDLLCLSDADQSSPYNLPKRLMEGIAVKLYSFLNLCASYGWVVNVTTLPGYSRERPGTLYTAGWVGSRAGLDDSRKSHPYRDSIPGASSQ
jgi:hypothetical protein